MNIIRNTVLIMQKIIFLEKTKQCHKSGKRSKKKKKMYLCIQMFICKEKWQKKTHAIFVFMCANCLIVDNSEIQQFGEKKLVSTK